MKTKPSVKLIRSWGNLMTWGAFKHKLVQLEVIRSVDEDAPEEWKAAYCKAWNRPYPMK